MFLRRRRSGGKSDLKKAISLIFLLYATVLAGQCWDGVQGGTVSAVGLRQDGTIWTWGLDDNGQLGTAESGNALYPTPSDGGPGWLSVSMQRHCIIALKSDGTIWGWGLNQYGQATGDGGEASVVVPTQIGTNQDWQQVIAGSNQSYAIKTDGTLWGWGDNTEGELGTGNYNAAGAPTQIGTASWLSIATGLHHIVGIQNNGTLWAWGLDSNGQLGNGSAVNTVINAPQQIDAGTWIAVAAGNSHSLAIRSDLTLWSWGNNNSGELGLGVSTPYIYVPTQVGTGSNWVQVSAGFQHTLGLKSDGSLWSWGSNANGQLGLGNTGFQNLPMRVGADNNWVKIAAGTLSSFAMKSDNSIWAWGLNAQGQLGDGTTQDRYFPTNVTCELMSSPDRTSPQVTFYPNPATTDVHIHGLEQLDGIKVEIVDITGRKVHSGTSAHIRLENLPRGVYIMKITTDTKQVCKKFLKS